MPLQDTDPTSSFGGFGVREKLKQTNQSDDLQLPAYVVVVEFGRPLAEVQKK